MRYLIVELLLRLAVETLLPLVTFVIQYVLEINPPMLLP